MAATGAVAVAATGASRRVGMNDDADTTRRERDTGQGYPEESQPGTGIDPHEHAENDVTPAHDAPQTSTARDGDAGQATGNPKAAGSEDGTSGNG